MLHRAYYSRLQTPPLRILWSKPTITHCERILASFKDFPYFPHFCKNRTWHPSGKPQCFAAFILASFKTAQYPRMFAHTRRTQKYPLFTTQPHRSWHPSAKTQCFATFNLASFKTTQYPCIFAHGQTFKKHRFCSRPHHNLASFKNNQFPIAAAQRPRPKAQRQKILKNLSGLCGSARHPAAQPPHVPPTNTTCGRACLGTARILTIKYTRPRSSAPTRQRSDPRPNPSIAPAIPS